MNTSKACALLLILLTFPAYSNEKREAIVTYMPEIDLSEATEQGLVPLKFMPGLYIGELTKKETEELADENPEAQIDTAPRSREELNVSSASLLLTTPDKHPIPVSNWWNAGFTGKSAVVAILDSGVPDDHTDIHGNYTRLQGLKKKQLIVNRGPESGFNRYVNGVRTAHGSGVACIYASEQKERRGIAYGLQTLLITLAGDSEVDDTDWALSLRNLDWLLTTDNQIKPNIINYSFGNGQIYCSQGPCLNTTDWSLVAQTIDYIVNQYQITWVKSAGNKGWIPSTSRSPFASTLSIPAESYNAIVVANMNNTLDKTLNTLTKTSDRQAHTIAPTSSRGPTLNGRRKPDITAPGNDTRTCAPTESVYAISENPTFGKYTISSQYDPISESRLAGGTSMATPHVGAAAALIYDSGIHKPMAIKALLINSADTWTDSQQPGPGDKAYACDQPLQKCGHGKIEGSEWNRTYGWGYINMDNAYKQRNNLIEGSITPESPVCYLGRLSSTDKVTLVWERRLAKLTPLRLSMFAAQDQTLIDGDKSKIDNVLQVSSYPLQYEQVIIEISVAPGFKTIEGAGAEPFALASGSALNPISCGSQDSRETQIF